MPPEGAPFFPDITEFALTYNAYNRVGDVHTVGQIGNGVRVRIPMIPYTQSDVFVRGRRRPRSGRRLGAYPVSSPPSRCLIDSLQALKLAVERVEMSR